MRTLERGSESSDLSGMVERTTIYYELYSVDPDQAELYWDFVKRGYRECGYEQTEINELETRAEAWFLDAAELKGALR